MNIKYWYTNEHRSLPGLLGWEHIDFTLPVCPDNTPIHFLSWTSHTFIYRSSKEHNWLRNWKKLYYKWKLKLVWNSIPLFSPGNPAPHSIFCHLQYLSFNLFILISFTYHIFSWWVKLNHITKWFWEVFGFRLSNLTSN